VRTVAAEYLLAMKLVSGRQYKNDMSDIMGILLEHQQRGEPIERSWIETAIRKLYGTVVLPETSVSLLDMAYTSGDYEKLYFESLEYEKQSRKILLEFEQDNPNTLKSEMIHSIIEDAKKKRDR
jgi:hypothetical protein